jgi:flagellin-like protein
MFNNNFKANVIRRRKLGISNLIGALLLIVITIAIAGAVAAYAFGLAGSSSNNLSGLIQTSATYVPTTPAVIVTLSVKNTGSEAWKGATVSLDGAALAVASYAFAPVPGTVATTTLLIATQPIAGGQTISTTFTAPATWTEGSEHTVGVTVTGMSGSTFSTEQSVTVQ